MFIWREHCGHVSILIGSAAHQAQAWSWAAYAPCWLLEGIDWRTREGQVLIAARAELTAHVGGNPNNVQKALIERAARLTLYIELMDARALAAGTMSERDSRQYLAMGQRAAPVPARAWREGCACRGSLPDLGDILAEHGKP